MQALVKILKGKSFTSLVGNGAGALMGLITFALLARVLNKNDFGIWIFFLTTYGLFDTLRIGMIVNALIKNIAASNSQKEEHVVIGSAFYLSSIITAIFLIVLLLSYIIFAYFELFPEYIFLFKWYAFTAVLSLPHNFASWVQNAKLKILSMSFIRVMNQFLLILYIFFYLKQHNDLELLFYGFMLSHLVVSLYTIFAGLSGLNHVLKQTKAIRSKIINFGKFSTGTLIGSNLLRSSDTYIINGMLGADKVAVYNVPMRILEVFEMPLRSFAITALPQFARLFAENEKELLKAEFERRTGAIFFMLLPLSLFCFFGAKWLVLILAGNNYLDSIILLQLFALYTAILPLDKFSGIMLDVIDKPQLNFIKVLLMLFVNVVGDILAIYYFKSLTAVAIVSTLTFITGTLYGFIMISRHIKISFTNVFVSGYYDIYTKLKQIISIKI
jgi:O-antigen/teichoic acid export membrane protein